MSGGPRFQNEQEFRYNRERRLRRASESVRWLEWRRGAKPPGLFKTLTSSKASRLLLFTIIGLVVLMTLRPLVNAPRSSGRLGGALYSISAFWYEGRVFLGIQRRAREGGFRSFSVSALAEDGQGAVGLPTRSHFVAGALPSEDFRMAVNAGAGKPSRLVVVINDESGRLELAAKVE